MCYCITNLVESGYFSNLCRLLLVDVLLFLLNEILKGLNLSKGRFKWTGHIYTQYMYT